MSQLLPIGAAWLLAALLIGAAYGLHRQVAAQGETYTARERRRLAQDWMLHLAAGSFLCGPLVIGAHHLSPDAPALGGMVTGFLVGIVAVAISRPPEPYRLEGIWWLRHAFVTSFVLHALLGGLLSMLVLRTSTI